MRALVWNSELEAVAQRWADQCTFGHDSVIIIFVILMMISMMIMPMLMMIMMGQCTFVHDYHEYGDNDKALNGVENTRLDENH